MVDYQIRCLRNIDILPARTLLELNVLGIMIKKRLDRDDNFVASNEYNIWRMCFVRLIRQKFETQYRDYSFYHVERSTIKAADDGILFDDLYPIFTFPLTSTNFVRMHYYAVHFAGKHIPEVRIQRHRLLEMGSRRIGHWLKKAVLTDVVPRSRDVLNLSYGV